MARYDLINACRRVDLTLIVFGRVENKRQRKSAPAPSLRKIVICQATIRNMQKKVDTSAIKAITLANRTRRTDGNGTPFGQNETPKREGIIRLTLIWRPNSYRLDQIEEAMIQRGAAIALSWLSRDM